MSVFDGEKYIPTIDAILSVADLEQVSVKRIRNALQELFVVKFEDDKKEISDLILERYHSMMEKKEAQAKRRKEIEEKDAILAAKLQNEPADISRSKRKSTVKLSNLPKKPRKAVSPSGNSLAALELNLSPKLVELLGETRLPRTQVVKRVWDYIKENDLQNPNDKREIICDDKMKEIFGKKVTMFQLNKVLSQHLYKDDE